MLEMNHRRRVGFAVLMALAGCGGDRLEHASLADYDGDGIPNVDDCAPYNPEIAGDLDGDGWYDTRCLAAWTPNGGDCRPAGEGFFLTQDCSAYQDCNDEDATVHPCGSWGDISYYEVAPTPPKDELGRLEPEWWDACRVPPASTCPEAIDTTPDDERPPTWSHDGVDNDCDGSIDVADWDGDRFVIDALGGADCNDCRPSVNPGIDEWLLNEDTQCPEYAYDGIDNDCRDGDVDDLDCDGQRGIWESGSACGDHANKTTGSTLATLTGALEGAMDCDDRDWSTFSGVTLPQFDRPPR